LSCLRCCCPLQLVRCEHHLIPSSPHSRCCWCPAPTPTNAHPEGREKRSSALIASFPPFSRSEDFIICCYLLLLSNTWVRFPVCRLQEACLLHPASSSSLSDSIKWILIFFFFQLFFLRLGVRHF
jgi:hypothetical protein